MCITSKSVVQVCVEVGLKPITLYMLTKTKKQENE